MAFNISQAHFIRCPLFEGDGLPYVDRGNVFKKIGRTNQINDS